MLSKIRMIFGVAFYNFRRWPGNARILSAFLLDLILCYFLTDKAVQFAVSHDITMQIFEPFIWTFSDSHAILLNSLLLLVLFSDMPYLTPATPFFLMRTSRKIWALGQLLYTAAASFVFILFTLFATVFLTMKNAFPGNRWSRTAAILAYSGKGEGLYLPSAVKAVEMSRPYGAMVCIFGLILLYTLTMVFVMLLLNLWKGSAVGSGGVVLYSVYGLLLDPESMRNLFHLPDELAYKARVWAGWFSPLNHATFHMHNFGYDKLPTLRQSAVLGIGFLVVLVLLSMTAVRHYAFIFTGTEGKS